MKRPEGFDAPAAPAPSRDDAAGRAPRRPRASTSAKPPAPSRSPKPAKAAKADAAERPAAGKKAPPRRAPSPSASRVAASELRAAERARKRAEKRELQRFTRRTRRRRIAWATGAGIVVALLALSLGAVYSPILALREIRVDGTTNLDPSQIVDAVDDQLGTPLALLDEGRLRAELGDFRLIRSYSTEILPPGTLILHIVERTALGVVVAGSQYDVLDAAGVVLASSPERPAGLPLIQVLDSDVDSAAFRSIAEVLSALPAEFRAQVDSISATTRDDVTLTLSGSTQRVVWGSADDSDHKARVLAALVAIHGGAGPGRYDVSAPGTAVFRAD